MVRCHTKCAALKRQPGYAKALLRRAQACENLAEWADLEQALKDYQAVQPLLPAGDSAAAQAVAQALQRLPRQISQAQEREKDVMMDKLRDLGNSVLGRFGLSTDAFQFQQSPGGGASFSVKGDR